eukprot:IDg11176t1
MKPSINIIAFIIIIFFAIVLDNPFTDVYACIAVRSRQIMAPSTVSNSLENLIALFSSQTLQFLCYSHTPRAPLRPQASRRFLLLNVLALLSVLVILVMLVLLGDRQLGLPTFLVCPFHSVCPPYSVRSRSSVYTLSSACSSS